MLVNHHVSRDTWRRMVASLKEAAEVKYIPEYRSAHEPGLNRRYYR